MGVVSLEGEGEQNGTNSRTFQQTLRKGDKERKTSRRATLEEVHLPSEDLLIIWAIMRGPQPSSLLYSYKPNKVASLYKSLSHL